MTQMVLVPTSGLMAGIRKTLAEEPEAADALLRIGLFEALQDQIEPVRQEMTTVVYQNMARINAAARRGVLRAGVSKALSEDDLVYVDALALADEWVAKGILEDLGSAALAVWSNKHPRDERGRFVSANLASNTSRYLLPSQRRESHSIEAVDTRDRWKAAGLIDDNTTMVVTSRKIKDGLLRHKPMTEKVKAGNLEAYLEERGDQLPLELKVARKHLKNMTDQQLAAVDLTALATGQGTARAKEMTAGLFTPEGKVKNADEAAAEWHRPTEGTYRQGYRRIGMTGQALSQVAEPGSALAFTGGVAQLVGDLGPEAEKILGPGIRRTAYRYRGTERRPDRDLYNAVSHANGFAEGLNGGDAKTPEGRMAVRNKAKEDIVRRMQVRGDSDVAAAIADSYDQPGTPDDKRELQIRGGAAIASMLGVGKGPTGRATSLIPDMDLTDLSLKSGEMPPSQGVIIDAHGRVVSQAVGYNGDHYLPFDLKNLNSLYGGQYVRTRATGGPTSEDIYTALVTGARQIQVISNSGVFTVEFDPDLRGVRRFNDKVARMTKRYGEMLETIHDGKSGLFESDLSPEEKYKLRQKAASVNPKTPEEFRDIYNTLEQQARIQGSVRQGTPDELEATAYDHATTEVDNQIKGSTVEVSPARRRQLIRDAAQAWMNNQDPAVRELTLNGAGYERALRALQQEFPYAIREATFESLPVWLSQRKLPTLGYRRHAPKEKGFVPLGQTNTAAATVGGARKARAVPTGRYKAPALEQAETTAATGAQGAPGAQGATTPAAGTAPTSTAGANKLDLVKLTGPEGKLTRAIGGQLNLALGEMEGMEPMQLGPEGATEEGLLATGPAYHYARTAAARLTAGMPPGAGGTKIAGWLMTQASPAEKRKFLLGMSEMPALRRSTYKNFDAARQPEDMIAGNDELNRLLALDKPYADKPEGTEAWQLKPTDTGRPAADDRVPALDASGQDWADTENKLRALDPLVDAAFGELSSKQPLSQMGEVQNAWNEWNDVKDDEDSPTKTQMIQNLQAMQLAWSFLHGRKVSSQLHELAGSDAGPKEEPAKPVEKSLSRLDLYLENLAAEVEALRHR